MLVTLPSAITRADDWPQWRGPNRDGVWKETGVVQHFERAQLPYVWTAQISSGYSGPTVAGGRVYITDRVIEPRQKERVHCFDSRSGQMRWTYEYDCLYRNIGYEAGPRAAVTIDDGRAFSLGSMGHLFALEAATGKVLWQSDLRARFNIDIMMWGIAAAPLVYKDNVILLIGGDDGACVVALDKTNGRETWRALNDRGSYAAPILIKQAGHDVAVCWTGDNVVGLNPQTGDVYWSSPLKPKEMVIGIATPVVHRNRLLVTSFYDGSKMMELSDNGLNAKQLWRARGPSEKQTEALHSIMATPVMIGDHVYGVDSYGELRCLEASTGERVWEDQRATPRDRWSNIHMVQNGEQVWMFNERGELIITKLSPSGYQEISRAKLIEPTTAQLNRRGKGVCWSHPAFANRHVFARNDNQLVCASLAE